VEGPEERTRRRLASQRYSTCKAAEAAGQEREGGVIINACCMSLLCLGAVNTTILTFNDRIVL
jgi:hypothetical protein